MVWSRRVRTWHRWVAVVVGLQFLMWTTSGLIFTWDPIEVVRGEAFLAAPEMPRLTTPTDVVPLVEAFDASEAPHATTASLTWRRGRWVWAFFPPDDGPTTLVDAGTGRRLDALDADEAARTADTRFTEPGSPVSTTYVTAPAGEYRGKVVPAWRVTFDDARHTNVYIDAMTGDVTSVRNDTWRRFDFFWMLHIMDYEAREGFHHPLLKTAAILGVVTAVSGLWLAFFVLRPRR